MQQTPPIAQAYHSDFALHTLGWKAFQDLCAQVCEESLGLTVSIYREAQDGGQDAVFISPLANGEAIASIQCKFTSNSSLRLKPSDIVLEIENVKALVAAGNARVYYFITSMGVDAPVALEIRSRLTAVGVEQPHVLGREWLTHEIKKSARLRALVPRVYGLGDLSSILDERTASQTRALLGHLLPSLSVYVPTAAHRGAVRTLGSHRMVLLLGAPATGKSMLAAILATMATDTDHLECLKCEGPLEMRSRWNPNEPRRLFWIDDAFGPNQLRDDYVDAWIEFLPKMRAAMELGCHFILTSRTHIWNEAKQKLGSRNHHLLANGKCVVNVGGLSPEERQQILYNHVKAGNQSHQWKTLIKQYLPTLSELTGLLPEIARRLGDASYTSGVRELPLDLVRFVREPQEFLKETIRELVVAQQAAMTLVFLARSRLLVHSAQGDEFDLVCAKYATSIPAIVQALSQLEGAFLVKRVENAQTYWGFVHPTFADAVSSILSGRPDLVDLYLRGSKIETLLSEAVCEGAPAVNDAVLVPESSFETLVSRLLETPNEHHLNEKLFQFLVRRAPKAVVQRLLLLMPNVLDRGGSSSPWMGIGRHADILLKSMAFSLGLLSEDLRIQTCERLEAAATSSMDISFIANEGILKLLRPHDLMSLTVKLTAMLENDVSDQMERLLDVDNDDDDIENQIDKVGNFVSDLDGVLGHSERFTDRLYDLGRDIQRARENWDNRRQWMSDDSAFNDVPTAAIADDGATRSIFSDVDE